MSKPTKSNSFLTKLATFIVDKRSLFFLLYLFAVIFSLFSMSWVTVESDVTTYLPEGTETRLGIEAMNENFISYGTARVMVSNVTYDTAQEIYGTLQKVDGVTMVVFDDTPDHYKNAAALYDVNFAAGALDPVSLTALETIEETLSGYDLSIGSFEGA